jgi:outer membrane protein assembly factor BamE (lipoprotein component of BamABCDE complex)
MKGLTTFVLASLLVGCASPGNGRIETLTQERAAATLVVGTTTKSDVQRELGDASVTTFPNGREVWFYRFDDNAARFVKYVPLIGRMVETGTQIRELKILFDQDGKVRKFKLQDIHVQ